MRKQWIQRNEITLCPSQNQVQIREPFGETRARILHSSGAQGVFPGVTEIDNSIFGLVMIISAQIIKRPRSLLPAKPVV